MIARGKVLVIDDDLDIRMVARMILEASGYQVIEAADGAEGLQLMRDHQPALVLLDLMMPGVDGFQFRALQRQEPRLSAIPVVVISGGGGVAEKAKELGVAGYLVKPFELHHLLAAVKAHVASP